MTDDRALDAGLPLTGAEATKRSLAGRAIIAVAAAAVTALAAAGVGFGRRSLTPLERVILGAAAFALMLPGLATDGFGMLALVVIVSRK